MKLRVWTARALLPEGERERVRVTCEEGRIETVEADVEPSKGDLRHDDATLTPGLIDLQVNGADGAAYDDDDPAARAKATSFHLRSGTTSLLATIVTAPLDHLERALARLQRDVERNGPILGIHLEGPFLADGKRGAHNATHLCDPTPDRVQRMVAAAGSALKMVTLAPERTDALEAIERFAKAGAVVAAGHSLATLQQVRAAIERGLSFVTHVGNASDWPSRPFDNEAAFRRSEPNVVGAFMIEPRLKGSLILDGHHLHPELARALIQLRGPENVALVSDATPAAGLPPGRYKMGGLEASIVRSEDGPGYATTGESLAGSVIALIDAVRAAVRLANIPLATAIQMATATPAAVLGLSNKKGSLAAGADADLLVLGPALEVQAVYKGGQVAAGAGRSSR